MSVTFTKLFSSITESTVWCESTDVRIVWITLLAMSDRHGRVWGSIPGIANRARVSIEAARSAISIFLSPDPDSRTKDFEGKRIKEIDGGWALLNHGKYRSIRDEEERRTYKAAKAREYRAKSRQTRGQSGQESNNVDSNGHNAEAYAEADTVNTPASSDKSLPAIGSLPCLKGSWTFNQEDLEGWKEAYPGIDVLNELRKDREWLKANPQNQKTSQGMRRHVNSWLSRAQDNSRPSSPSNGFHKQEPRRIISQ